MIKYYTWAELNKPDFKMALFFSSLTEKAVDDFLLQKSCSKL